jgi:Flp pilus assembly protein TadB
VCNTVIAGISHPSTLENLYASIPFSTKEYILRAMSLSSRPGLAIDTREPPTPPSHFSTGEIRGLDSEEQSTILGSADATEQGSTITASETHTTALSTSTTARRPSTTAFAQAGHTAGLSGTAVLCIILGGIVAVILALFVLLFCIKRSKHEKKEKESLAQALEMRGRVKRERKIRR